MAKPNETVTPANRVERWKKLWGTPRKLEPGATDDAFDEFADALVPSHMHKMFLKTFGVPKAQFGNRYFMDGASFQNWDTKLATLVGGGIEPVEVVVIYGSPDRLEAHALRGERRRTLRDIVIDDWQAACAIVRAGANTLYVFVEPKMRGCIVRSVRNGEEPEDATEDAPTLIDIE
jgi:hypothetical protein